jgi:DNA processing protein
METKTFDLLTALNLPGIGTARGRRLLLDDLGHTDLVAQALAIHGPFPSLDLSKARDAAIRIRDQCSRHGIACINMLEARYPSGLRAVKDAPPLLYARGEIKPNDRCIAVVGTRDSSRAGNEIAAQIAGHLVTTGHTVVSGLAFGIDFHAHKATLDAGGRTVAVLAHGLDSVSPAAHAGLASDIIARGGCLLGEHPPGTPPQPHEFVRRNRIQSGMSSASVIVEGRPDGGAMHHARYAIAQGRQVFVVEDWHANTHAIITPIDDSGARRLSSERSATPIRDIAEFARRLIAMTAPRGNPSQKFLF